MKFAVFHRTTKTIIGLAFYGLFFTGFTTWAANLEPYSLRSVWYIEDLERPYWEIRVTCDDHKTYRYMVRYDQSEPWCAKQASGLCAREKVELAFELCKATYTDIVEEAQKLKAVQVEELAKRDRLRSELLKREAVLRERRSILENRKAELQRREQDLNSRERVLSARKAQLN